jgi:hypothetical protein
MRKRCSWQWPFSGLFGSFHRSARALARYRTLQHQVALSGRERARLSVRSAIGLWQISAALAAALRPSAPVQNRWRFDAGRRVATTGWPGNRQRLAW